MFMMKTNI
jgi:hypothetical protein